MRLSFLLTLMAVLIVSTHLETAVGQQLADLEQQAFSDAVAEVSDSVVQIRTIGGLDRVGKTLISQGPTTGLIVSDDGYIVSSAFNFASQPSSILVRLADGQQHAAELIARDKNRMLVLLKINADRALPVPTAVSRQEMRVGQWAIALGRTFQADQVDVSIGIVSATNRMYGRVLQTDANVSVANYGGPLVDLTGRVFGILVPMSPQASGDENAELAGAEFYDSGIGFAVPLEHVLSILKRWKAETELLPGKLGIGLTKGDAHVSPPKITSVWTGSPAAKAKWQAKDIITSVNGTKVETQAQLRFQIMPLYAGDSLQVSLDRNGEPINTEVTLAGKLPPYRHAFLGILPTLEVGDETEDGLAVRLIWPESPAELAGLETGDRIIKIDDSSIKSHSELRAVLTAAHPGKSIKLSVARGEQTLTLDATLARLPEAILQPADLAVLGLDQSSKTEEAAELQKLKVPEFSQEAVYFVPETDQTREQGMMLWLGNGEADNDQQLLDDWQPTCERYGLVLVIAPPKQDSPWSADDLGYLQQLVRLAGHRLKIDRARTIVIGESKGGQLAYALALSSRSGFGGVISIDAPLPRTLTPRETSPNNRLAVLAIESKDTNFAPLIRRDLKVLREAGYPTTWLQKPQVGEEVNIIDEQTQSSIERWVIGLDRL